MSAVMRGGVVLSCSRRGHQAVGVIPGMNILSVLGFTSCAFGNHQTVSLRTNSGNPLCSKSNFDSFAENGLEEFKVGKFI